VEELVALMPLITNKLQLNANKDASIPVQAVEKDYEAA